MTPFEALLIETTDRPLVKSLLAGFESEGIVAHVSVMGRTGPVVVTVRNEDLEGARNLLRSLQHTPPIH